MTGELRHVEDDSGERCVHCGARAAGPCASCHDPVCGDCTVLTEGGVKVWAICLACDGRKGKRLTRAWWGPLAWVVAFLAGLALLTWLAERLFA